MDQAEVKSFRLFMFRGNLMIWEEEFLIRPKWNMVFPS